MVGKWVEGFETHTAVAQLDRKYASRTGNSSKQPGRVFGNSVGPNALTLVTPSLGLSTTYVLGFGMRLVSQLTALNSNAQGLYFEKGSNEQLHIEIQSNVGSFEFRIMRGATQVAITSQAFVYGVWGYFEFKITIDDTVGAVVIRENEVEVLNSTGLNLADDTGSQADVFAWRYVSNLSSSLLYDDLYIIDTTGAINNDFLGDSIVEGVLPNADGTSTGWTNNGSGANYTSVDDADTIVTDVGAGGTNGSDTNTNKDLYDYEDLVQIQGNIHFVQVGTQLGMAAAGSRDVKTVYRDPDTTEADGVQHTVDSTTFDEFTEIMDVNPASAVGWDVDDINNGQFGVEVVS